MTRTFFVVLSKDAKLTPFVSLIEERTGKVVSIDPLDQNLQEIKVEGDWDNLSVDLMLQLSTHGLRAVSKASARPTTP